MAPYCDYKTDDDRPCPTIVARWEALGEQFKNNPQKNTIKRMSDLANRIAIELELVMEIDKKRELAKLYKDVLVELHKIMYGTKSHMEVTKTTVDINQLVKQAQEADKEIVDEDGQLVATVQQQQSED